MQKKYEFGLFYARLKFIRLFFLVLSVYLLKKYMAMKKPIVDEKELYTIPETCRALGIDRRTLNRYTAAGSIRSHIRKADNRIVYFGEDIIRCYYTVA